MARKKHLVILAKLAEDSHDELDAMLAELSGNQSPAADAGDEPAHWSRRFTASGKSTCAHAPRIRL